MSDLICLLVVIMGVAVMMSCMFSSNGGAHAPHNFLDWVSWLMAVALAVFTAWATFSVLPMSFDLSKPVLVLLAALSVPLMVGMSWGFARLSRKYDF